jgi:hypothetical protein
VDDAVFDGGTAENDSGDVSVLVLGFVGGAGGCSRVLTLVFCVASANHDTT